MAYEEIVDDLEGQARRLLEYCDLPWDDRCLRFHETSRVIRTASNSQVRQPIYRGSVGRWRRFEPYLQPLLVELEGCRGSERPAANGTQEGGQPLATASRSSGESFHVNDLVALAETERCAGQLEEAAGICRFALQIDPNRAEAYNNLGAVLRDQGEINNAVASFERARRRSIPGSFKRTTTLV